MSEEALLPVRSPWVRDRMRVPELERLLGGPIGARIDSNFDSLRVRLKKVVDRIGEQAEGACEEIRKRANFLRIGALSSAAVGLAALAWTVLVPAHRLPAGLIAFAELSAVVLLGGLQRRLARDLIAADAYGKRYLEALEAARIPEDLHRLTGRIREEYPLALGRPPEN